MNKKTTNPTKQKPEEIQLLRISLQMAGINTNDQACDLILEVQKMLKKVKGNFSLSHASDIQFANCEKYKPKATELKSSKKGTIEEPIRHKRIGENLIIAIVKAKHWLTGNKINPATKNEFIVCKWNDYHDGFKHNREALQTIATFRELTDAEKFYEITNN